MLLTKLKVNTKYIDIKFKVLKIIQLNACALQPGIGKTKSTKAKIESSEDLSLVFTQEHIMLDEYEDVKDLIVWRSFENMCQNYNEDVEEMHKKRYHRGLYALL